MKNTPKTQNSSLFSFSFTKKGRDGISFGYKLATVVAVKMSIYLSLEHFNLGFSSVMYGIIIAATFAALYLLRKLHPTVMAMSAIAMMMPYALSWITTTDASAMIKLFIFEVTMIMNLAVVLLIVLNELFYSPTPEWLKRLKTKIAGVFG